MSDTADSNEGELHMTSTLTISTDIATANTILRLLLGAEEAGVIEHYSVHLE